MSPFVASEPTGLSSAGNALKHGFCAEKILSPEILSRAEAIREELTKIHDHWSDEEIQAVDQLALARAQQFELERAMRLKIDDEKKRAAELFDRAANDRLADDLAPDDSGNFGSLPFSLACEASMALNSPWQVDRTDFDGGWLMACYVRIAPDPEAAISLWVEASKAPDGQEFSMVQARRILAKAPADRSVAAAELVARAKSERSRWSLRVKDLRSDYETAMAYAAEAAVGTGSGDPELEKGFRLLSRYLTSARNRADRFERRLDALKRDRKRLSYRKQKEDEREARRLREESRKAMNRFENETHRHENSRADFYASPGNPEYAGYDMQSHGRDFSDIADGGDFESLSLSGQPHDPMPKAKPVDQSQASRNQRDASVLRNENPSSSGTASFSVSRRPVARVEKEPADETRQNSSEEFAWLDRRTPLLERLPMMRYRNWAKPEEVFDDEVEVLRRLVAISPSEDGDQAIRNLFGSPKILRRCWKSYQSWAGAEGTRVSK